MWKVRTIVKKYQTKMHLCKNSCSHLLESTSEYEASHEFCLIFGHTHAQTYCITSQDQSSYQVEDNSPTSLISWRTQDVESFHEVGGFGEGKLCPPR